jgi:hypothetical protein
MAEIALLGLLLAGAAYGVYRYTQREKSPSAPLEDQLKALDEPVVILPTPVDPPIVILPPPVVPTRPKPQEIPFVDEFHVNDEHIDTIRWLKERNKAKYGDDLVHLVPQVVEILPEITLRKGSTGMLKFRVVSSPFPDKESRDNLRELAPLAGENALIPGTAEIYAAIAKTGGLPGHIDRTGSPQLRFTGHSHRVLQGEATVRAIGGMVELESYAIILYMYSDKLTEVEVELNYEVLRVDDIFDERFRGRYVSAHPETGMIHWSLPVNVK